MDEDSERSLPRRSSVAVFITVAVGLGVTILMTSVLAGEADSVSATTQEGTSASTWHAVLTPGVWLATLFLLFCSAFFSASEVAFYSLHKVQLRALERSSHLFDRLAARLMKHPGSLLTSILMGNSIVNVLIGVILAARVEKVFTMILPLPAAVSYGLAVLVCTAILVFFGEITPKLLVVRRGETFARIAAAPIFLVDQLLSPARNGMINFMAFLFRITRISEVRPAPFMTDEEFKSLLSEGEATGVIEEVERQMIQGILEVSDVTLKEILVPRPDMVALSESATIGEALTLFREHEFARMPVFGENLDNITGVIYAKDLIPSVVMGELEKPVKPLIRKIHFVPEVMSIADFMRFSQRMRTHLVIVVDEFGGTEGLVTLQDALREVVGDIGEENDVDELDIREIKPGIFRLEGGYPLDELEELTGIAFEDEEHTTIAGFIMEQIEKIPETGDQITYKGATFTVEAVEGKRVERLTLKMDTTPSQEVAS